MCKPNIWNEFHINKHESINITSKIKDLKFPYKIYKEKESDTLFVKKDNCTLKFLLFNEDS